jgi:hypothetical protein
MFGMLGAVNTQNSATTLGVLAHRLRPPRRLACAHPLITQSARGWTQLEGRQDEEHRQKKTANGTGPCAGTNTFTAVFLDRAKSNSVPATASMHRASPLLQGTSQ